MFYAVIPPINNPVVTGISDKPPSEAPAIFANLFSALIGLLLAVATLWAFVNLLQGGIQWISSGGDKTALESARNRIMNAILGLFITFAVWTVYIIILQFLGITEGGTGGIFSIIFPKLF